MNCDNMRVQIYDISGRRRMDEKVVVNDKILSLDLSLVESGVYYYLITDENTSIVRDTFIKY